MTRPEGVATTPSTASTRGLSPDRLAALEEERDFLLRSLADLEAEHDAGDLGTADFAELHDDYTVRAADLIRQIDDHREAVVAAKPRRSVGRILAWVAGLVVFAVAAGWLLAQAVGERGVDDQITGSVDLSPRDQFLECQFLDQQGSVSEANECYSEILAAEPDNPEALTYKGWLLERTAVSAVQLGAEDEAVELHATAVDLLDQAVESDPSYPDARAFRIILLNRDGDTEGACAEYSILQGLDPPAFMLDLVAGSLSC